MEILEQKPFEYILYKLENRYTLSVTHKFPNHAISVDIIYRLDDNDIEEYYTNKEYYLLNQEALLT